MNEEREQVYYSPSGFTGRSIVFGIIVALISAWIVSDASWIKIIIVVLFAGIWTFGLSFMQATNIEYGVIFLMGLVIVAALYILGHPEFLWPYVITVFIGSLNGIMGRTGRKAWERDQLNRKESDVQREEGL